MEKISLGPPIPASNGIGHAAPINLASYQRAIVAQLQADEGRLAVLRREVDAIMARIHAGRGKLDLIAELDQALVPAMEDTPASP